MRNFLLTNIIPCIGLSRKALQVVEIDGNVLEFKSSILVKELLMKFEGFGVKSSRKCCCKFLHPNFEMQMGRTYYLFPIKARRDEPESTNTTVRRIKVVITKKQLEELLSKKTTMEKIVFGIDKACSSAIWKPSLVPIPEENEMSL